MKRKWVKAETFAEFFAANPELTQVEVAIELGITQSALSLIVSGKRMPRPDLAILIQEKTGVTYDSLLRARTAQAEGAA